MGVVREFNPTSNSSVSLHKNSNTVISFRVYLRNALSVRSLVISAFHHFRVLDNKNAGKDSRLTKPNDKDNLDGFLLKINLHALRSQSPNKLTKIPHEPATNSRSSDRNC